ncbi:ATP-binding protein [Cobetia marina]|uniref:ATP-binding protein n=1 Tax=Cobetia marina TaxID=28258 RepID=UPI001144301E|nr:ATP-binding protein [Cobetia marina]GED42432.1 ATPase [Cobetia marina]
MYKKEEAGQASREIDTPPNASALIEGHRDFGYDLKTALADVIDNSISAGATSVKLEVDTSSDDPWLAIVDNGTGMSEEELIEAMRLGSKNPTDARESGDLGRFGLGLKSASFSQCRSLTVLSRKEGVTSCARWDLDHVARRNTWALELLGKDASLPCWSHLEGYANGTAVLWEKLDRLSGGQEPGTYRQEHMNSQLADAEAHLRLVFHRFMERRVHRLVLTLNGRELRPLDPMASNYKATQKESDEKITLSNGDVNVLCHTLPHHGKLSSEDWEELGGSEGHLKSQGFYIYRGDRLIIAGGWLGLARQSELTKLCRVRVDIPNSMDSDWKIDVKKASAQLPPAVRIRLKKIVERFSSTSKRTYQHKGNKLVDREMNPIWNREIHDSKVMFKPNFEHPIIVDYLHKLPESMQPGFIKCIQLIGMGLPIEAIYMELSSDAESVLSGSDDNDLIHDVIHQLIEINILNGIGKDRLIEAMGNYSIPGVTKYMVKKTVDRYIEENDYE